MKGYNTHISSVIFLSICTLLCHLTVVANLSAPVIKKRRLQLSTALNVFNQRMKKPIIPAKPTPPTKLPANKLTQTESYMHRFKNEISRQWGPAIQKHDAMIKKIIAREKEYIATHYVFYHAHKSGMRLIHDIIKELYRFFFQQPTLTRFKFMRFWKDYSPFSSAHNFLDHYKEQAFNGYFDCERTVAQQLLCVNLSLFGNRTYFGESTFGYFLHDISQISDWFDTYLKDLFTRLGIETKWANRLMPLAQKLFAPDGAGQIVQIFVPKQSVDTFAYVSHAYGTPHGPIPVAPANIAFDQHLKRHKSIKPILESYQNNPFEMDAQTYDNLQARVILNAQIFDPSSNVKIYRYSSIPKNQLADYKKELRAITAQALDEWCTQYAATNNLPVDLKGSAIDTILKKIN